MRRAISIELNDRIMEPEEFGERADDFSSFRYYKPDEQGLQIYHNQPINNNDIGLVDFRDKSILGFDMEVADDSLVISYGNSTIAKVENWSNYQPAREMMFAFNDTIVSNSRCIVSICNSEDVIVKFNKEKAVLLTKQVFDAIVQSKIDIAKDLVKKIEKIDTRDNYELTLLYVAIRENRLDVVKLLFDRKYVSVKGRDAYHHTPLHWAIQEDRLGIVKFLLDEGADIEAKDLGGWTSIYYAIYKNNFDILKFLIDNGADIEAKDINDETPLHIAVKDNNKPEVIRLLLDNGARIEAKNKGGWTPLHYAAYKDNLDACKLLLERNADVEAKNTYDETPLHVAAENSNKSKVTVELLLDTGANINAKNKDGWVPLHYAAYKDNLDICKLLLERDASIEAKTNDDRTPLDIANYMKHSDVVEYLKKVKEERGKPVQRRRRHHHGDHNHHGHLSRKPLAIDSINQPEIAASSGTRPSSWINDCISWVKSSVGRLLSSKSEGTASSVSQVDGQFAKASISNSSFTGTTLPSDGTDERQENVGFFRDNVDYVNANLKRMCERQAPVKFKPKGRNTILEMGDHYLSQVDFNGTITLFDLLIRRVTGQKYVSTADQSISPLEAQGYALNITKGFEKVVEQAGLKSGISIHRLNIDFVEIQKEVKGKIMSGKFNEISGVLKSYVEKGCPGEEAGKLSPKKFDKFMIEFNKGLDVTLNQSIEQILHNGDGRLEIDGVKEQKTNSGPQSYLSNASVQGHLTRNKVKLIS